MIFFSLIFKSQANWPWIVEGIMFAILLIVVMIVKGIACLSKDRDDSPVAKWVVYNFASLYSFGPVVFCCYRLFCGWTSSGWWFYLIALLGVFASFIPGGFSIMTVILTNMGAVASVPVWVWIIIAALDAFNFICLIGAIKNRSRRYY